MWPCQFATGFEVTPFQPIIFLLLPLLLTPPPGYLLIPLPVPESE